MRNKTTIITSLACALLMSGCASSTNEVNKSSLIGNFGERPVVTKAVETAIIDDIKERLKDPYSAKFKVFPYLKKGTYHNVAGWVSITSVNAKNSFGGYTGDTGYASFIITNQKTGKFASVISSEKIGTGKIVPLDIK